MGALDRVSSLAVSTLRFGLGRAVVAPGPRPEQRLELYEFEACPFCRKVREALSMLDLEAVVYPCPKRGTRFRPRLRERGGREQFPYLVDPGAGTELYESDAIIAHLFERYGAGAVPLSYRLGPLTDLGVVLAGAPRAAHGVLARDSKCPETPLELWSFEASPGCRLVRERLCELELPYLLHNVAKGSRRDQPPSRVPGVSPVPRLFDPNRERTLLGVDEIVAHLESEYALR